MWVVSVERAVTLRGGPRTNRLGCTAGSSNIALVTRISPETIDTLLYMPEGQTLDFKMAQYPIAGASDAQKSEFVKDILAFANAWKDSDAYILIGVQDNHAPPASVVGGVTHIDDATLQQLVNKKTNRAVHFEYVPINHQGKSIALIRIRKEQERPLFLLKSFGKLHQNVVYIRRGSSTFEANPDEIAKMGLAATTSPPSPSITIREHGKRDSAAGTSARLVSRVLEGPSLLSTGGHDSLALRIAESFSDKPPAHKVRQFLRDQALLRPVVVIVDNPGRTLAVDVQVELRIPAVEGLEVRRWAPQPPHVLHIHGALSHEDSFAEERDGEWLVLLLLDKIQPGTSAVSDPLWIGSESPHVLTASAKITGDNFSPIYTELTIAIDVEPGSLDDAEAEYERSLARKR